MSKLLSDVISACGAQIEVADIPVKDLRIDSRAVNKGDVFLAVKGQLGHGSTYISAAIEQGAAAVLTDKKVDVDADVPIIFIERLGELLGDLSHYFYNQPSEKLKVLAVTGTNGKTSVAWFLMHALNHLGESHGQKAGYIGTLGVGTKGELDTLKNTTPSVVDVHRLLAGFLLQGMTHVCIEVSSHALDQGRIEGVYVEQALFTNLSRDHLDYHETMVNYAKAKYQLFDHFCSEQAIINKDDSCGQEWLSQGVNSSEIITYGISADADWKAGNIISNECGLRFDMSFGEGTIHVDSRLMGRFNVENLLLVAASLHAMTVSMNDIATVLNQLEAVPGRMDVVDLNVGDQATWVVDYAHTPDALSSVLSSLRSHVSGRLFCVFGCGGDRDKGKRALMGQAAEQASDVVIITDDNPRYESPKAIVEGVLAGMKEQHEVVHLRSQALKHAKHLSQTGDVILVAGKGHEDYQEIEGVRSPYNDIETIKAMYEVAA
ncbi:UDP-N-acetylmuramoyl-L-alanyl-D-glutamate--2,6-diaminopimelate ligase [Marinicella rhabdoformis]|uniref:UDP-N-acetylmuramoyl-L-alanyl-D-glutamate--2, 6-diaminopimelate ligase n=1 Tax=Marinicella rhabdoformis TaxID=2580566 RepID=UPI0015D00F29|nr:UDP-N-acetylmuramoyl-L-alanyl-D-glutamate--2,6-diaminopimelate ligase [Marinicella rhabdoformis]